MDQFSESTLDKAMGWYSSYLNGENDCFEQIFTAFRNGIKNVSISWTHTIIPVILLGLLAVSTIIVHMYKHLCANKLIGVHLSLFLIYFFCYLAVLFVIYLCGMSTEEAMNNASMDRYVACFIAGWSMILFGLLLDILRDYNEKASLVCVK